MANTLQIVLNGASGRMGKICQAAINAAPDLCLIATLSHQDNLAEQLQQHQPDIVIDFTHADYAFTNSKTIIDHQCHPVIGTSGLTPEQITTLQSLAQQQKLGGIIAPNFSIGAMLMVHLSQIAARFFQQTEIIEKHHAEKRDAPSGTALHTAQAIVEAQARSPANKPQHETILGARGAIFQEIPIHAVRGPGFMAHQEVIFSDTGETLTIKHDSIDRRCFEAGILFACREVTKLDHCVYGLEKLLFAQA